MVRGGAEETLNELLEKEAVHLTQAARYERSEARQGYRSGHYGRNLTTTSGDVSLHIPRLNGVTFGTESIERCRSRERSVEEALIELDLVGISAHRVEDITEVLWRTKESPFIISELNKKSCCIIFFIIQQLICLLCRVNTAAQTLRRGYETLPGPGADSKAINGMPPWWAA